MEDVERGPGGAGPLRLDELDHAVLRVLHRNPRVRLGVPYSRLDGAVRLLAAEPAIRYRMVTSGQMTLLGYSSHRTLRDFRDFAARVFKGLDHVTASDTALLMGSYKRAGFTGPAG
ncbi:hypothetical protein [Streptomyces sp. NPDC048603]|uniref:hypothetical protein n=1 Tax=Streptomyces sp. NPDC048603 TaxID=3365577 RepID=UPI00371894D5